MGRKKDIEKMTQAEREKHLTAEQKALIDDVKLGRKDPVVFAEKLLDIRLHPKQMLWLWLTTGTQDEKACKLGTELGEFKDEAHFKEFQLKLPARLKNILVPSNRWGKTLVTSGVKHLWYNFYKIGVQGSPEDIAATRCGTLNLSPHSNQCQAGYDYILDILTSKFTYRLNGESFKNKCRIEFFLVGFNKQQRSISFKNGTTYRAVPTGEDQASSLAGTRFLYISYDECAQSLHLKDELPAKVMSRLIDFGGPLDLVSTPEVDKPSHQYFFHIAKLGLAWDDGWFTLVGSLQDNIFLATVEVEGILNAIKTTDPAKYRQVKYGEFVTTGKKMFDNIIIERIWNGEYEHSYPQVGRLYLQSVDWGFADTGDPTVTYVLDYTDLLNQDIPKHLRRIHIAFRESIQGGSPFMVLARQRAIQREWNGAKFIHDSGSMGGVIIKKMLAEMDMPGVIDFSASGNKMDMLFMLIVVLSANRETEIDAENKVIEKNPDFGRLRGFYIPELNEQLGNYQYNPDKGVTDKKIAQDEVMALGQGVWWLERKLLGNKVKTIRFNPLASKISEVIPDSEAQKLGMHTITIPEKRIF